VTTTTKDVRETSADPDQAPGTHPTRWQTLRAGSAFWVALVLLALVLGFGITTPHHAFFEVDNLFTVLLDASELLLLTAGMTYLLGAGELDLSVGSNVVLSSVVAAEVITKLGGSTEQIAAGHYPHLTLAVIAGVVAAIGCGTLFGAINGLLVTRLRITSFIVTLATLGIGLGTAYVITHGTDVPYLPGQLQANFGIRKLFGVIPLPVFLTLVIVGVLWFFLAKTRFGTWSLALGSSAEAVERAGIDVARQRIKLFALSGMLAGTAAIIDISRFGTTNVSGHQTDNLQAIAAAVIGGTSLFGGVAAMGGSVIGTMIPVTLSTGLVLMSIDPFYQLIAVGLILLVAVYFQQRRRAAAS
jgi:ribose transport system permease protein